MIVRKDKSYGPFALGYQLLHRIPQKKKKQKENLYYDGAYRCQQALQKHTRCHPDVIAATRERRYIVRGRTDALGASPPSANRYCDFRSGINRKGNGHENP